MKFISIILLILYSRKQCAFVFRVRTKLRTEMGFVEVENCTLDKKIICIAKCQKDAKCNQAIFNIGTKNCFLNSGYLSNPDILTIESKFNEKVYPPKSQNECLSNTEYWSKK